MSCPSIVHDCFQLDTSSHHSKGDVNRVSLSEPDLRALHRSLKTTAFQGAYMHVAITASEVPLLVQNGVRGRQQCLSMSVKYPDPLR